MERERERERGGGGSGQLAGLWRVMTKGGVPQSHSTY